MPTFNLQAISKHPDPMPMDPITSHLPKPYDSPPALNSILIDHDPCHQLHSPSAPSTTASMPSSPTSPSLLTCPTAGHCKCHLQKEFTYYFQLFDQKVNDLHAHMEQFFLHREPSNYSFQYEQQIIQNLVQSFLHCYFHMI
ncbi:hypothetical protein O181_121304 [Austropuccinia psidii MF-1]|uniref:Uncharacterized protein n=1 Tax=Austropuccinia psidii MF-1 TaxID=1389203 RepID=A0A9Q3KKW3_9BASI|nr:hypothetical protein [Austropuccinia psidii MF-1]